MRIVERESRRPDRKRLRLAAFDYSTPGYYFVTLCISGRRCLLGDGGNVHVIQSVLGQLVSDVWRRIPQQFSGVVLDEFVIMPNHLHALIQLTEAGLSLSALIGAFKSVSTNTASR